MLPCFKEKAIAQLLDFNKYTKKKNRQTHPSLSIFLFIFTCVVVAFCPVNPLNFLLHFYAISVWIRREKQSFSFCAIPHKSQCFQASAAFITEAEILTKPARIRRYLISYSFDSSFVSSDNDYNILRADSQSLLKMLPQRQAPVWQMWVWPFLCAGAKKQKICTERIIYTHADRREQANAGFPGGSCNYGLMQGRCAA